MAPAEDLANTPAERAAGAAGVRSSALEAEELAAAKDNRFAHCCAVLRNRWTQELCF